MFRPDFLVSHDAGEGTWLHRRLAENGLADWSPRAPIRLYFGSADLDVSPQEALVEAERLSARGGDVQAVGVGNVDHDGSVLAAIPVLRGWFDALASPR
jgi:hypothetical protein